MDRNQAEERNKDGLQDNKKQSVSNEQRQAVDKQPGEERGQAEQVTDNDLKGKKVDADPEEETT